MNTKVVPVPPLMKTEKPTSPPEERLIDTVEAFQALEAVVDRMGRDYVDTIHSYTTMPALDDPTETPAEYGCLLGHWMGEIGLSLHATYEAGVPYAWLKTGIISYEAPHVHITTGAAELLRPIPTLNDARLPWGEILDEIRDFAGLPGELIPGETTIPAPHSHPAPAPEPEKAVV